MFSIVNLVLTMVGFIGYGLGTIFVKTTFWNKVLMLLTSAGYGVLNIYVYFAVIRGGFVPVEWARLAIIPVYVTSVMAVLIALGTEHEIKRVVRELEEDDGMDS